MIRKLFVASLVSFASFVASAQTTVTITVQTPDSVRTLLVPLDAQITFSHNSGQGGHSVLLKTPWWSNLKPLTNWIDNSSKRNEAVGQAATDTYEARIADYYYTRNFTTPRVNPGGDDELMKHGRYSTTGKTPSTEYYVYHNGGTDSLGLSMTVQSPSFTEKITGLRLALQKAHKAEADSYDDWIATGMENRHCGDCSLGATTIDGVTQPAFSHHGMHLFASVEEAREYVDYTPRSDYGLFNSSFMGEGQYHVFNNMNICLNDLVETHFSTESGMHGYFPAADLENFFYYRFSLTSFQRGSQANDESQYACILTGSNGKSYLHPQDPTYGDASAGANPAVINYDLDNWSRTTDIVVNHVPLVRVELVSRIDDRVIDFGYIPIRIVKDTVSRPATYVVFDGYQTPEWSVSSMAKCIFTVTGAGLRTTTRNTEEDLFMLANKMLGSEYPVLDNSTFNSHYYPEINGFSMQQYLAKNGKLVLDAEGKPKRVQATPLKDTKIGDIYYEEDDRGDMPPTFEWTNITLGDIQALANIADIQANGLQRAVKLMSDDPVNYPTIYVIFKTPAISVSNTDITLDAHVKEHIIPQLLYKQNSYNELGSDEIHVTTVTPEGNNQTDRSAYAYYYDMNRYILWDDLAHDRNKESGNGSWTDPTMENSGYRNAWKPAYLDEYLSNIFAGNLLSNNTPAQWITMNPGNASLLAMVRNNALDLDFVFDDWNIGKEYKGYTNEGLRTFKLSVSANKKFLFAEDKGHLAWGKDTIAEIVVEGAEDVYANKWNKDVNRLQMMRIDYKRHTRLGFAEALLNYKGSQELDDETILAKVALVAYNSIKSGDIMQNAGTIQGDIYCELPMINYSFDVRFLRPLNVSSSKNVVINYPSTKVVKLRDIRPSFTDWRGLWETGTKLTPSTNDYEQYYAPNDMVNIDFQMADMLDGMNLATNRNVITTLGSTGNTWIPLYTVTQNVDLVYYDSYIDPLTGTAYNEPVLVYNESQTTFGDFKVRIPTRISYYWGYFYDNIEISIVHSNGN